MPRPVVQTGITPAEKANTNRTPNRIPLDGAYDLSICINNAEMQCGMEDCTLKWEPKNEKHVRKTHSCSISRTRNSRNIMFCQCIAPILCVRWSRKCCPIVASALGYPDGAFYPDGASCPMLHYVFFENIFLRIPSAQRSLNRYHTASMLKWYHIVIFYNAYTA